MTETEYDVEIIVRTGPYEQDVVGQATLRFDDDGTAARVPLALGEDVPNANLDVSIHPKRRPAPATDTPILDGLLVPHHHHPLHDKPCPGGDFLPLEGQHAYLVLFVDEQERTRHWHCWSLEAGRDLAEERRGLLCALPIIADYTEDGRDRQPAETAAAVPALHPRTSDLDSLGPPGVRDYLDAAAGAAAADTAGARANSADATLPLLAPAHRPDQSCTCPDVAHCAAESARERNTLARASGFLRQGGFHDQADALDALVRHGMLVRDQLLHLEPGRGLAWFRVSDQALEAPDTRLFTSGGNFPVPSGVGDGFGDPVQ